MMILWLLLLPLAVVVLGFVGGLLSAMREVRSERRAGVPVTRPAWDDAARAERRLARQHLLTQYFPRLSRFLR